MFFAKQPNSFPLTLLLLCVVLAGFYFPWLSGQQDFYRSDITYYFQPLTDFIVSAYRRGQLPLWNPYLYCGMAQIAVPSPGMFYPGILLFVLMPFSQALSVYMLLHQLLAGVGAFLLIGSFGWGGLAAAIAAIGACLCGYMFSLSYNYTLVAAASWLPLLLYILGGIDGTCSTVNLRRMCAASFSMYCLLAAGRPEISLPACILLGIYILSVFFQQQIRVPPDASVFKADTPNAGTLSSAGLNTAELNTAVSSAGFPGATLDAVLWRRHWTFDKKAWSAAAAKIISLTAGVCLSLPVILPALEWLRASPRAHGLDLRWVLMWSANWYDLLMVVLPQPLGDLTVLGNKFLNLGASRSNCTPYLTSTFLGPIFITLAVWSLGDRQWRWKWPMVFLLFGFTLLALGSNTPVSPFISALSPVLSSFRYPVKLMVFPIFILVLLAARGTHSAVNRQVGRYCFWGSVGCWLLLLGVGALLCFSPERQLRVLAQSWGEHLPVPLAVVLEAMRLFGSSLSVNALLGLFVCANYFMLRRRLLSQRAFGALVGSLAIATLVLPAVAYARQATVSDYYRRPSLLAETLRQTVAGSDGQNFRSRVVPLYFDPLTPGENFMRQQKLDYQRGFYLYARYLMLANTNVDYQIPYSFGYEAAEVGAYKELFTRALSLSSQNRNHDQHLATSDLPMARFCYMTAADTVLTQCYLHRKDNQVPMLDSKLFTLVDEDIDLNVRRYKTNFSLPRAYLASGVQWNIDSGKFEERFMDSKNYCLLDSTFVEGSPDPHLSGVSPGTKVNQASPGTKVNQASPGTICFVEDQMLRVVLRTKTSTRRLLVLTDHYYPGWRAAVDKRPVPIYRVNSFARGVCVPAGNHSVEFEYSPQCLWQGLSAAGCVIVLYILCFIGAVVRNREPTSREINGTHAPASIDDLELNAESDAKAVSASLGADSVKSDADGCLPPELDIDGTITKSSDITGRHTGDDGSPAD